MYTHTHMHSLPKNLHTFAILVVRKPRNFPVPPAPLALIFRDGLKHILKKKQKKSSLNCNSFGQTLINKKIAYPSIMVASIYQVRVCLQSE